MVLVRYRPRIPVILSGAYPMQSDATTILNSRLSELALTGPLSRVCLIYVMFVSSHTHTNFTLPASPQFFTHLTR